MDTSEQTYFHHMHDAYKEMAARVDAYSTSTFDDFKLFAVAGAILAWKPIADYYGQSGNCLTVFFGFVAIAAAVAILEARSLLKLSLIRYYMQRLRDIETALRACTPTKSQDAFNMACRWDDWFKETHRQIGHLYFSLLYGTTSVYPTVVLYVAMDAKDLAIVYLVVSVVLFAHVWYAEQRLGRQQG
ncbi:MAG TPA: hypothetical protein VFF03_06925 [Rhodocyclaceae bacterium]|nr:hypothetical protein [Rhodocyclaceae bacterium]